MENQAYKIEEKKNMKDFSKNMNSYKEHFEPVC